MEIEFAADAAFLAVLAMVNLVTDFGDLDISYQPAGFAEDEELVDHAVEVDVAGVAVWVASLDDVIHSKETANRPKDHATLPILRALQVLIEACGRGHDE